MVSEATIDRVCEQLVLFEIRALREIRGMSGCNLFIVAHLAERLDVDEGEICSALAELQRLGIVRPPKGA